jgi:8-oxo-dGTP pyrophosphatase MutT (NUDIX family)
MELLPPIRNDSPPLPSATVMLLRDGAQGLEVFLLKRNARSDVLAGAYVFPGGKVDPEDGGWLGRLDTAPGSLQARLGEPELAPEQAAGVFVAAVREVFEETGLLFAPVDAERARAAWAAQRAGTGFAELLASWEVQLSVSQLHPWSRWITPTVASLVRKRFDVRFFVAGVPAGQSASHDGQEATASVWLTPQAALRQYWDGTIEMAAPQLMSLAHLARHASVQSALTAAQARRPPCIRPEPLDIEGERVVCYPGDPGHPVREQLLPGPTRLHWRNQRFEPAAGLAILLGD